MSFSLVRERHVTPCPSNPVKRAIYESSKLDFERHCAPLFYGGFQDFLPRFIKFRTEKLFDIYIPLLGRKLSVKIYHFP